MQQSETNIFEIEREGETLVVVPAIDLGEPTFQDYDQAIKELMAELDSSADKNVVLDFHKTHYFGSTALGFFMRLWRQVLQRNGRMAFCNVSDHELEILKVTRLDEFWPICTSRPEALAAVRGSPA